MNQVNVNNILNKIYNSPKNEICFIDADNSIKYKYKDLFSKISHFEDLLVSNFIKSGDILVAIADHDIESYALFLASIKSACIFVPTQKKLLFSLLSELSNYSKNIYWYENYQLNKYDIDKNFNKCNHIDSLRNNQKSGLILFTSGSTGNPKGIVYDLDVTFSIYNKNQRKNFISIPFLLFDHFGGINTVLNILTMNGTIINLSNKTSDKVFKCIEKYRVTFLPTTPSFLTLCLNHFIEDYDLTSLSLITYGSEVMSETVLNRLKMRLPNTKFLQTYGLSETGVLKTKSSSDGTWIKLIEDGYKYKISNNKLLIKSSYSMMGYLGSQNNYSNDWFETGDLVESDGDYLRILGRDSDIVNIAGNKVYPAEIENVIHGIENVIDVVVFGEKNLLCGNILVAQIICNENINKAEIKNIIRKECIKKLDKYKVPNKIILSSENLYSNRLKKIRKKVL